MVNHKKSNKTQKHTKKQKVYRMKGCSSSCKIKSHNHKKYLGGDSPQLSYPSADVPKTPNPFLAYTGSPNIDAKNSIYPSSGPSSNGFNFLNPQNFLHGGKNKKLQKGGNCGCNLQQNGGQKCDMAMKGGGCCSAGNGGIPYPNGLLGKSWTPNSSGWPGVNDIAMDRNHLGYNTYSPVDISRQMIDEFSNPFKLIGGRKNKKINKKNKYNRTKKIKGGAMSNLLGQDLINLGRQISYGMGSAYNTVLGYPSPANPLPWKDQLQNKLTSTNNILKNNISLNDIKKL
jgi:hypothetical protein